MRGRLKSSGLCLCQTFRYWGRCKENKTKKNPAFLMLYFSLSVYLEWVIISYIAVLSYLEQSKGRVIYTLYIDCML